MICPLCDSIQEEFVVKGDKFAWMCRSCRGIIENGKPHLLGQSDADFYHGWGFGFGREHSQVREAWE